MTEVSVLTLDFKNLNLLRYEERERVLISFRFLCTARKFEILSCEDCRLAAPPGFFRGFGPRCRAPRFRVRMLRFKIFCRTRSLIFDYC